MNGEMAEPLLVENVVFQDDSVVFLVGADHRVLRLVLSGDCCSRSYFPATAIDDLKSLFAQTILKIESVMAREAEFTRTDYDAPNPYNDDCMTPHCLKITTDKQAVSIDWRNESNGYYDGECHVSVLADGIPDGKINANEYHYGVDEDSLRLS